MKRFIIMCALCVSVFSALFAKVDVRDGKLRLVIEDYDGNFYLYRKNVRGNYVSLLDSKRYSLNSGFYVLYGKSVQKLMRSGGVSIASEQTSSGARLTFSCEEKFVCTVDFTFLASDGKETDSIRIDAGVKNISDDSRLLGLRVFFDTWLGENSGQHFSTALRSAVVSECYFNDMSREQWIQSSNDEVSLRFLFEGNKITPVQTLALANKDVLSVPVWAPVFVSDRKFDSLQSYNNSALSAAWEPRYLNHGEELKVVFYISTGAGRIHPADYKTLRAGSFDAGFALDKEGESMASFKALPPPVDNIRDDDEAYIRFLIARVRELEADPSAANREQILKLTAEIDEVLLKAAGR